MKYLEYINKKIKENVATHEKIVLFGQNVNAGSCIGGLTRGLKIKEGGMIINSTNSENSLCGLGFGLMLGEVSSIFFMKQLDFLLLSIDHLVNTFNIIRSLKLENKASFTIFPVTVDNGYQGPQSSCNNFAEFCSIARIPGYCITNKKDADEILKTKLTEPGFRIITISQRLVKEEIIDPEEILFINKEKTVFQYNQGKDLTIVSFNFSFPQANDLFLEFKNNGVDASLFNVNSPIDTNWEKIREDVKTTKNIIILDDSNSYNIAANSLIVDLVSNENLESKIILKKEISDKWLFPNKDLMEIDYKKIVTEWKNRP
jgi:pyruvate/2-oxoglutarate/acetoin dehydrogenase E1 component